MILECENKCIGMMGTAPKEKEEHYREMMESELLRCCKCSGKMVKKNGKI